MKDFTLLKQSIIAAIRENGVGAITGSIAQEQMLLMVDAMELSEVMGIATPNTTPTTDTTSNHVYFATAEGDYSAFVDGTTLTAGDCFLFVRAAGDVEWTAVNLTDGLMSAIASIATTKQDTLAEGDGISIDDNEISVFTSGAYLRFVDGSLTVVAADEYGEWEAKLATGGAVASYIASLVGETIAPLDEGKKVPKENMQDDVAYYDPDSTVEVDDALVEEYDRTLRKAYEAIDAIKTAQRRTEAATAQLADALERVSDAIEASESATDNANTAAEDVRQKLSDVDAAIQNANAAVMLTNAAVNDARAAADTARQASSQVVASGEFAQTQGTYAMNMGDYAKDEGDYAKAKGDYALEEGDYAKDKGDAATAAIDEAKGDFPTMNDRFANVEYKAIDVTDEDDPTTILE